MIIVTHGERAVTERCLESLDHALGDRLGRNWQLVLVDNDSPDDTPELLESWRSRATVELLSENLNFAGGCNRGAELACGEALVFLNNDTEVPVGALEALVEQVTEPGIAAAGCRLLYPDGTVQHAGVVLGPGRTLAGDEWVAPYHVFYGYGSELAETRGVQSVSCVTAACLAVRADVFRAVGGFDAAYRNGFEDVDLCLKLRAAGHQIVYRGDVDVIHHEGLTRGRGDIGLDSEDKRATFATNQIRLRDRWSAAVQSDDDLAELAWAARVIGPRQPDRCGPRTTSTVIFGNPSGIGPWAAEARALMLVSADGGEEPAIYDEPLVSVVEPVLQGRAEAVWRSARERIHDPGALCIYVPPGERVRPHLVLPPAVLRLGSIRTKADPSCFGQIWASCAAIADALVASGVDAENVRVVPPPVVPMKAGAGGGGVIVILPVQEPPSVRTMIAALRSLPPTAPITLIPNVWDRRLPALVQEGLPAARLLSPISDESVFSELAAGADVVVTIDPSDVFERHALVAAQAGSAVVVARRNGPAADVLGTNGLFVVNRLSDLAEQIQSAETTVQARLRRHAAVRDACGPEALLSATAAARRDIQI